VLLDPDSGLTVFELADFSLSQWLLKDGADSLSQWKVGRPAKDL
jgi:hypothetical protein